MEDSIDAVSREQGTMRSMGTIHARDEKMNEKE